MIQTWNIKFGVSVTIYFEIMLIKHTTHTYRDQPLKMWFSHSGASQRVNPSKFPFQKRNSKTIFFSSCMGKTK